VIDLTRETLEAHSADMRQFIDARAATLDNGMRTIDVHNSSGLTFSLLPDRGLDVFTAWFNGVPLTWQSMGAPHVPDMGSPWLRQFNGGLLVTCGLRHAGPGEVDDVTGEVRDVHGLYTRLRAHDVNVSRGWEGATYTLTIRGTVAEASLFGEQLRLERAVRVVLGQPSFTLTDVVTNHYDQPVSLMVLYHFNLGYPLVRAGSRLHVPADVTTPRDEAARAGVDSWDTYGAAVPGYDEQVFFHDVRKQDGWSHVLVENGEIGLELAWDATSAPRFTQWKNLRRGIYVSGIEPGNCWPEGQNAARANGRLEMLAPGESRTFTNTVTLAAGDALASAVKRIDVM
jgi:hypothetical protein